MNGSTAKPNWENRTLYHGDNLDFMRSMNSATVDLIATDPPFNKGKDFHATPESLAAGASFHDRWRWDEDVHPEWTEQMQDDWPGVWAVIDWTRLVHSDAMAAFLCYMAVRVVEMHRILRDDGSIYLHCDPTASHYLKTLLDAVFGAEGFRNELTWERMRAAGKGSQHEAKNWASNCDRILYYAKSRRAHIEPYRPLSAEEAKEKFDRYDEERRERYYDDSAHLHRPPGLGPRPNLCYAWSPPQGPDRHRVFENRSKAGWCLSRARMDEEFEKGNIRVRTDGRLERRKYERDHRGMKVGNIWTDIDIPRGEEDTRYPTQKPLALYQRIIRASSRVGDIVFDPFAGCATIPVAAEMEGRWWTACDLWPGTVGLVRKRLEQLRSREVKDAEGRAQSELGMQPVVLRTEPLVRSDDGETAAPTLKALKRKAPPPSMKREQMVAALVAEHGITCLGCGRSFDSTRYLELDHQTPRSDGGSNELANRVLLCGPCNRTKSNVLTLSGLRRENQRTGFMTGQGGKAKASRKGARGAER